MPSEEELDNEMRPSWDIDDIVSCHYEYPDKEETGWSTIDLYGSDPNLYDNEEMEFLEFCYYYVLLFSFISHSISLHYDLWSICMVWYLNYVSLFFRSTFKLYGYMIL